MGHKSFSPMALPLPKSPRSALPPAQSEGCKRKANLHARQRSANYRSRTSIRRPAAGRNLLFGRELESRKRTAVELHRSETGKFSAASCNIHATITTGAAVGQFATRGQPCTVLIYRFS